MDANEFMEHEQRDPGHWPALTAKLEAKFKTMTADAWVQHLAPLDACINKVLTLEEAKRSEVAQARQMYLEIDDFAQPVPAPRFSRTRTTIQSPAVSPGEGGAEALLRWRKDEAVRCRI